MGRCPLPLTLSPPCPLLLVESRPETCEEAPSAPHHPAPSWLMLFRRASAMQKRELPGWRLLRSRSPIWSRNPSSFLNFQLSKQNQWQQHKGVSTLCFLISQSSQALALLGITQVTKNITGALSVDIPKGMNKTPGQLNHQNHPPYKNL